MLKLLSYEHNLSGPIPQTNIHVGIVLKATVTATANKINGHSKTTLM